LLGTWNDLTYLNGRFKYVIENGGLGQMMAVDRTGGGQLVCVISLQMPTEVISLARHH